MAFPSGAGAGGGCTWSCQRAPGSAGVHCTAGTVEPALLCAPVSLAPSPPHSSSPALLAAIAKPRAGIRIQLGAWTVDANTPESPRSSCPSYWRPFQPVGIFWSRAGGLVVWAERRGGLGGGQGRRAPATALPHLGWGSAPSHVRTQFLRFLRQMLNLKSSDLGSLRLKQSKVSEANLF